MLEVYIVVSLICLSILAAGVREAVPDFKEGDILDGMIKIVLALSIIAFISGLALLLTSQNLSAIGYWLTFLGIGALIGVPAVGLIWMAFFDA